MRKKFEWNKINCVMKAKLLGTKVVKMSENNLISIANPIM